MFSVGFPYALSGTKWIIMILTLLLFPVVIFAAESPKEALQLQEVAQRSMQEKNYDLAWKNYEQIIRKYPNTDCAVTARGKLVEIFLEEGQEALADTALTEMMVHSDTSDVFKEALHGVGRAYRWAAGNPAKGREVYQQWLEQYNDDQDAYKVQCSVVKTWMEEKDLGAATKALGRFKELCKGNPDVTHELTHLADLFRDAGRSEISLSLYQWYLDNYKESKDVCSIYAGMIVTQIVLDDRIKADSLIETLMAESDTSEAFKNALDFVGETYRWRLGDHAKCQELYSRWLESFSDDADAYKFQSRVVQALIEGEKSLDEISQALERFKELCGDQADVIPVMRYLGDVIRDNGHPELSLSLYQWYLDNYDDAQQAGAVYAGKIVIEMGLNNRAQMEETLDRMMSQCDKRVDIFDAMAYIGLTFRNNNLFGRSLKLYHWYTGLSAQHLDRFLNVYEGVQGFKDEVNDALDKSHNPQGRADFLVQMISQVDQSQNPIRVISFYAEHCGGEIGKDASKSILSLVGEESNSSIELTEVMDALNRYHMSDTAIELCKSFLAEHPQCDQRQALQLKIYECMLMGGEDSETVLSHLEDFLASSISNKSEVAGMAITLKGKVYIQGADLDKAMACFREVIEQYPQYSSTSQAMFFLGYCYVMQNDLVHAKEVLESMLDRYPYTEYGKQAKGLLARIESMT